MKWLRLALPGLLLLAATTAVSAMTLTSTDAATAIPDEDPAGISMTIDTTGSFDPLDTVVSVYLQVSIDHTRVGHLAIELTSPDGTELQVLARPGSSAGDESQGNPKGDNSNLVWPALITFQDGMATSAEDLGASVSGTGDIPAGAYFPDPNGWTSDIASFAGFNGETAGGLWTLKVADYRAGDVGTLVSWSLVIVPEPATGLLLGLGLISLAVAGRPRRRKCQPRSG
jgi:subtilisin-like proprotein convertase family protein